MLYNGAMDFLAFSGLNGNWVDLILFIILIFFLIEGITDRFIPAFLNLIGFVITFGMALKFYSFAAKFFYSQFSLPHGIANALGFFAAAIIIETLYNIAMAFLYKKIPQDVKASKFNKYMGFLP